MYLTIIKWDTFFWQVRSIEEIACIFPKQVPNFLNNFVETHQLTGLKKFFGRYFDGRLEENVFSGESVPKTKRIVAHLSKNFLFFKYAFQLLNSAHNESIIKSIISINCNFSMTLKIMSFLFIPNANQGKNLAGHKLVTISIQSSNFYLGISSLMLLTTCILQILKRFRSVEHWWSKDQIFVLYSCCEVKGSLNQIQWKMANNFTPGRTRTCHLLHNFTHWQEMLGSLPAGVFFY